MAPATRQAAWRNGATNGWHDDLVWYAAGIHQMRLRTPGYDEFLQIYGDAIAGLPTPGGDPVAELSVIAQQWADPRGLGYQSQVHGTFVAKAQWPSAGGQQVLWQECAHNHWFFLPWHRAYLLEFEAIVRGHVVDLGGPATWALPYWNYSDHAADPRRLRLPRPLRGATLPAGVVVLGVAQNADGTFGNPLFIPTRVGPDPANGDGWATATVALLRPHYANQQDTGAVSLGGGVLENPNDPALFHGDANEIGMLDLQPHGSAHVEVGGAMGQFETAALDPVFWMHHANIDRLWETYAQDLGHGYPFTAAAGAGTDAHQSWTNHEFRFLRADGATKVWKAPELIDLDALGYDYDTTAAPPLPAVPPPPPPGSGVDPFGLNRSAPEPIADSGAAALTTEVDLVLSGGENSDTDLGVDAFPADTRWLLRFEGIRSGSPAPTSFHVYLGLPSGATADPADAEHYAGLLSLFGVFEASRDDGTSAGTGQRRLLDVSDLVTAQSATLRPLEAPLRLVATNPDRDIAGAQLSIERISLEFA